MRLQVPGPCHKDWDQMTETGKGRYCLSCRKEVIDFTLMSDQQILKSISRAAGGVCGRFNSEQLNRDMELKKNNNLSWYKYLIHVMIPAMLVTNKSSAQSTRLADTIVFAAPKDSSERLTGAVAIIKEIQKPETITVEGTVSDEKLQIIPGASVLIKGTTKGTNSDAKGYFKIRIGGDESKVTLVASSIGYGQKEFSIDLNKATQNLITTSVIMKEQTMGLGEVVVLGYTNFEKNENKTIIQSVKDSVTNFFKDDAVRIYPNPTQKGSTFNIDFDVKNIGEYNLTIVNISGQRVMQRKIYLDSKKHIEQIQCDDRMRQGIYFVQVENLVNKKICMHKLLVQ
jgi:hypothetical protein